MKNILPFMVLNGEQKHITENYVSIPPALVITDEAGNIWTLGFTMGPINGGEYTFNVLKNGVSTGEFANRIERRKNEIWIFGANKWKRMHVHRMEPTHIFAIKATPLDGEAIPIRITIYKDSNLDQAIIDFRFNSIMGGLWEGLGDPIICRPGEWLIAVIDPFVGVSVTGYVGGENLRVIPIREGVRK